MLHKTVTTVIGAIAVLVAAEAAEPNAEILLRQYDLSVKSETDARLTVKERIRINNEKGSALSDFILMTDAYREISSFSGTIENGGKIIKKIKQTDVISVQSSESFADDSYANFYSPNAPYPYVVEYNYTVSYKKAIATFPSFFPVTSSDTPLEKASYTITVPKGMKVNWKSSLEPAKNSESKTECYKWEWEKYLGFKEESYMPPLREIVPYVYASPSSFKYDGYSGSQDNWEDIGKWLYSIFPEETELPESIRTDIRNLTGSCPDDLSKVRALYSWLREHTRYVSIQLGIGGYSPMPPSKVIRNGYGDCKALSFLMKKMLAEAGIKSEYLIVNTDRRDIFPDYSSIGQMNHAMLCIPMPKDTIWMECTNPAVPLGFRHSAIAGHQCVLVTENGGKVTRAAAIPDSLHSEQEDIKVQIKADESINGSTSEFQVHRIKLADDAIPYEKFARMERKNIVKHLSEDYNCGVDNLVLDSVKENFDEYAGEHGFVPRADIDFHFSSKTFAKATGDRLIFPLSPSSGMLLAYQKTARVHPFIRNIPKFWYLNAEYSIPDNYEIEFVPQSVRAESASTSYSIETNVSEDRKKIHVTYSLELKACCIPAERYSSYRDFIKEYNNRISASIILKKSAR